jgi:hypothetical protein
MIWKACEGKLWWLISRYSPGIRLRDGEKSETEGGIRKFPISSGEEDDKL